MRKRPGPVEPGALRQHVIEGRNLPERTAAHNREPGDLRVSRTFPLRELARMKAAHLKVMLALLDHDTYRDGTCSPALRWIAGHGQLSLAAVQRAVKEMAALAYITIEPGRGRQFRYLVAKRFAAALFSREDTEAGTEGSRASPAGGTQSPPGETQSPASGTEKKENSEYVSTSENPAARARGDRQREDLNNTGSSSARSARPEPAWRSEPEFRFPIDGGRAAPAPGEKAIKRQNWIAKIIRFVNNRYPDETASAMCQVIWGQDEGAAQRILDKLDRQMRAEGWDDRKRA